MAWKKVICCCASPKINLIDEGEWVEPILPRRPKKKRGSNIRKGMTRSDILTSSGETSHNARLSIIKEQLSPLLVEEEETASLTEESSGSSSVSSENGSDSDEMQPEEVANDNNMLARSSGGGDNTRRIEDPSDIMHYVNWYSSTTPSPVARRKMNQRLGASH